MPSVAITREGVYTDAGQYAPAMWEELKGRAAPGDFLMPCCRTAAVLKTSPNGLPFFAHLTDECRSAPETAWHLDGKALIVSTLATQGVACSEEVPGGVAPDRWEADTLFRIGERTIVVELQRSYQHLRDYQRRQARYQRSGVECYWLTRQENLSTLIRATGRLRMQREWGGKFPLGQASFSPLLPDFPVAVLVPGDDPHVQCPGLVRYSLAQWLSGIIDARYTYHDGAWLIR